MAAKLELLSFLFCLLFLSFEIVAKEGSKPKIGSYKTTLIATHKCNTSRPPYEETPTIYQEIKVCDNSRKTKLLCGNITVIKISPYSKLSSKGYILENGKWRTVFTTSSSTCQGFVARAIKLTLNIQTDDPCIPKGTYPFRNVDFNLVQHIWMKKMEYGTYRWTMQIFTKTATAVCWEYHTVTSPINDD